MFAMACFCDFMIDAGEGDVAEMFGGIFVLNGEGGGIGFEEFQHGFK